MSPLKFSIVLISTKDIYANLFIALPAEDIVTRMHDFESTTGFRLPQTIEQLGDNNAAWLAQFPQEIRTLLTNVEQLLRDANAENQDGQQVQDSNGFNTPRQRRHIFQSQQAIQGLFQSNQVPVADRFKCYRCYNLGLAVSTVHPGLSIMDMES